MPSRITRVALLAVSIILALHCAPDANALQVASAAAIHQPPVEAEILDPFRPPSVRWGAGNRGLEYETAAGVTVRASSGGRVTFAGQVGGTLHVTVRHTPALVTTVSFVGEILVSTGDAVEMGQPLARTGGTNLHFSARRLGVYIDPQSLFREPSYAVRLIPVE